MEILIKPVVSILVLRTGTDGRPRLLLQRRSKPGQIECWELPQGKIRQGETLHVAAARELLEESGLCLTRILTTGLEAQAMLVGGHQLQSFDAFTCVLDVTGEFLAVAVLAQATGDPVDTDEARGHQWMDGAELQRLLDAQEVFPLNVPMLHKVLSTHFSLPTGSIEP